mgnify:CR=1 FL=1
MESIHEENLCTAIFRRLNQIGFSEENVENEYIHLNFIMYFLNKVLPSSYFLEENYELTTSLKDIKVNFKGEKKILTVKTIYEEERCLLEISYGENTMYFGSVENPVNIFIDDGKYGEIFKVDKMEESFTYYFKTLKADSAKSEELYCGKLTSINACMDNKEYFEFERLYPKVIHEGSFWENIKNRKHRKRVIGIPKGNSNFTIYDDVISIFGVLQKEGNHVMKFQEEYAKSKSAKLLKEKKEENS